MKLIQCSVSDLVRAVEALAPPRLAEPWDRVGLLVGHPGAQVRRVMTCLELTPPVLAEAVKRGADAVVAHHPLFLDPLASINLAQPAAALVADLIRNNISLIAAHTNLDAAAWGTNQALVETCGWEASQPLIARESEPAYLLVVKVCREHVGVAVEAVTRAGGGPVRALTPCGWPTQSLNDPVQGNLDPALQALAGTESFRLEAHVAGRARREVERTLLEAIAPHQPAIDWLPTAPLTKAEGLGLVATLPWPMALEELVESIKTKLGLERVRLSGPVKKKILRVAVCTGSGGSFIGKVAGRAEAYLTGEINYHHAIEAHARGIAVIEMGHFESERLVVEPLARRLAQSERLAAAGVEVIATRHDLQPFREG